MLLNLNEGADWILSSFYDFIVSYSSTSSYLKSKVEVFSSLLRSLSYTS